MRAFHPLTAALLVSTALAATAWAQPNPPPGVQMGIGVAAPAPNPTVVNPGSPIGLWDLSTRQGLEFQSNGAARTSNGDVGTWYWVDGGRNVVVTVWKNGNVDTLLLSPDGARLDGVSLNGTRLSAVRHNALPPPQPMPQPMPPAHPAQPVPQPMSPVPTSEVKRTVNAGPLWNGGDAQRVCPSLCPPPERWNGQWWTTVQGSMSVCECVATVVHQAQPLPQTVPEVMHEGKFRHFLKRIRKATFSDAQLEVIRDEVKSGAHWHTRQLIEVMQQLKFGDAKVGAAVIMWPSVVDPQNFGAVAASMTFETDRQKLRQALGR